jgi:hypothetical protein
MYPLFWNRRLNVETRVVCLGPPMSLMELVEYIGGKVIEKIANYKLDHILLSTSMSMKNKYT